MRNLSMLAVAAVIAVGCGSSSAGGSGGGGGSTASAGGSGGASGSQACVPGSTLPITCPGGGAGYLTCSDDGLGFGPPMCPDVGGGGPGGSANMPCVTEGTCVAADLECLGLVDNKGKTTFGLRMSQLDIDAPKALTTPILKTVIGGGVTLNGPGANGGVLATCNENISGEGTFNWLLQFDTGAGTLKTGGAKPVADPTMGYSFVDEMLLQGTTTFHLQPVVVAASLAADGSFGATAGAALLVPIFLNASATEVLLLPIKMLRFNSGKVTAHNDCIGRFNGFALQNADVTCAPDDATPAFVDGASLDGFITLEDADTVQISALQESLCVLLANEGSKVCKRDASNKIIFKGDWCSTTNTAASATCSDAVRLSAKFAASSVLIN